MTDPKTHTPKLRALLEADLSRAETDDSDSVEAATLRLAMCAVHDRDADARAHDQCEGCDDSVIRDVLSLMVRQREESADRSLKDLGRCMTELKSRYPDQLDSCEAGRKVRAALG